MIQENKRTISFSIGEPTDHELDQPRFSPKQEEQVMLKSSNSGPILKSGSFLGQIDEDCESNLNQNGHSRRGSSIISIMRRPSTLFKHHKKDSISEHSGSKLSLNKSHQGELSFEYKKKNRRIGDDALSTALSGLYCKFIVILGIALPVTEVLTSNLPVVVYQGFYVYLYLISISFVIFVYICHIRTKAHFSIKDQDKHYPKRTHFGSFYLRIGAIAFTIGTMVYSGLELGQFLEHNKNQIDCLNTFNAFTPAFRMLLSIVQMQFIFLNTSELDMGKHKIVSRFGLMHMVATNLCEWLHILVVETKHEIYHLQLLSGNSSIDYDYAENTTDFLTVTRRETFSERIDCKRTSIMGKLIQDAAPFLFPCTIEYSLICAVILYEMWKQIKTISDIDRTRRNSVKVNSSRKAAHHFTVDCSRAHKGLFCGVLVIVLTIICLIMYFVLADKKGYEKFAMQEVTIYEIILYIMTTLAVIAAMFRMRDLKYFRKINDHRTSSISLDCTLLVLAQTGIYLYCMFSIMGSYFTYHNDDIMTSREALIAEILSLVQTSFQTLFILNAAWRKCRGAAQNRSKPGREIITFLLVANVALWFINTMIKSRASFRPSHLIFFGKWAWTVITHVSMPLAIFYRFHSTICLFEIWKSAYKCRGEQ